MRDADRRHRDTYGAAFVAFERRYLHRFIQILIHDRTSIGWRWLVRVAGDPTHLAVAPSVRRSS